MANNDRIAFYDMFVNTFVEIPRGALWSPHHSHVANNDRIAFYDMFVNTFVEILRWWCFSTY